MPYLRLTLARLTLVVLAALFLCPAFACINGYEGEVMQLLQRGDPDQIAAKIAALESSYRREPTIAVTNDLAVLHILAGQYPKAVTLLQDLEKRHPGLSRTASNLGTALELAGNNAQALEWIKEGIRRDPQDHDGTEWLHVKILEAKLGLAQDPDWLRDHTVLGVSFGPRTTAAKAPSHRYAGVDFGPEMAPQRPAAPITDFLGKQHTLQDTSRGITYQLKERLKFVKSPDPIITDLYLAMAHIATLDGKTEAHDYYQAAFMFWGHQPPLSPNFSEQDRRAYIGFAIGVALFLALAGLKRRMRRANRATEA